ncbi:hypothetical protein ES707_08131 [subsurface metagenome]
MVRIFLVLVSVCSIFFAPGLFIYVVRNKATDLDIVVNSLMPVIILIVVCIALYKIIAVLEEIRDKEK